MDELEQVIYSNIREWTHPTIQDWVVEAQAKEIAKVVQESDWLDETKNRAFNEGVDASA